MIKIDQPPLPKFMALIIKSNDNDHDVFYTTYQVRYIIVGLVFSLLRMK